MFYERDNNESIKRAKADFDNGAYLFSIIICLPVFDFFGGQKYFDILA